MTRTAMLLGAAAACLAASPLLAQGQGTAVQSAQAKPGVAPVKASVALPMVGADGKSLGSVTLQDTPGGVLVKTDLRGLPPGEHGFHFHEKGQCDAAQKFTTAGAHFQAGSTQHGLMVAGGHHGGDMPNAHVGSDGLLKAEWLNTGVTLSPGAKSLADADGSALVIHAKPDDYKTQPSGDAGDRIGCAVVAAPKK